MINADSVRAVEGAVWRGRFRAPLYESYSFLQVPRLIPSLFDTPDAVAQRLLGPLAAPYDTVMLVMLDAFGWRFIRRYQDRYPFLQRFLTDGMVTRLTSQFPSTTAAHVTAIHTGLPVNQSGIYEWFMYEPSIERVIMPLYYSFAGDTSPNMLEQAGFRPDQIFPERTIYQSLAAQSVRSHVFQHQSIAHSNPTRALTAGAQRHAFPDLASGLRDLAGTARIEAGPAYSFFYWGQIDAEGHRHGPDSPRFEAEADRTLRLLEEVLMTELAGMTRKALLLVTADHGLVGVPRQRMLYLNHSLPEAVDWLQRTVSGTVIPPSGSPRDMVMHVAEERLEEARDQISAHLKGCAEVVLVSELAAEGFFGAGEASPAFTNRMGNLMVIPYENHAVWWDAYYRPTFIGWHGGLAPAEMDTELLALAL